MTRRAPDDADDVRDALAGAAWLALLAAVLILALALE